MTLINSISGSSWKQRFITAAIVASALYIGYRWTIRKGDDGKTPKPKGNTGGSHPTRRRIHATNLAGRGSRALDASRRALGQIAHGGLTERNKAISEEIKRELTAARLMPAAPQHPSETSLGKTGIDIFTHQHEILPGVWLGDYRFYLSLDSAFHTKHPDCMVDPIESIYDSPISEAQRREYESLDFEGTTYLGIKHVISATRFTPAASVAVDDWSRFEPDLEAAGIQHTTVAVDDDDFA